LVGGSLAWFTSSAEVTNTFTVGNVSITLDETTGTEYLIVPGALLDKDPTVTVKAGSADCWVYVYIDNQIKLGEETYATPNVIGSEVEGAGYWVAVNAEAKPNLYRYSKKVEKSDADTPLTPVFTTVTIAPGNVLTNAKMNALDESDPNIAVTAFAIQADNIESEDADEEAWAALGPKSPES
jgi:predicted ribosomally synthesized peptide with SipW-like signal peptide